MTGVVLLAQVASVAPLVLRLVTAVVVVAAAVVVVVVMAVLATADVGPCAALVVAAP